MSRSLWILAGLLLPVCLAGCSFDYTFGEGQANAELQRENLQLNSTITGPIRIAQGDIQGALSDANAGIRVYRGIPYAEPPTGALRFRPPEPPKPWQGVRSGLDFGTACWQTFSEDAFVWARGQFPVSEDCLYLNVFTGAEQTPDRRPVMVWFHGGSHTVGYGHSRIFDGTALARQGVVVVSINYRLGPLGFLAHSALTRESEHNSSGNYGLLYKIAALRWVKQNISAFGGDADNVTIFGQSAGSSSVCYLMASPEAKGLFHKAIGQSAACMGELSTDDDLNGEARGQALVARAGLGANADTADLRALQPQALLAAAQQSGWAAKSRIVIDGWVVPKPPLEAFEQGLQHAVPLLVGSMADEGNQLVPLDSTLDRSALVSRLQRRMGPEAQTLLSLYASQLEESPGLAQRDIFTDQFMAWSMRHWAAANARNKMPAYLYFFEHIPPAFRLYLPHDPNLALAGGPRSGGAYHSGDLAYVFGSLDLVGLDWNERDREISKQLTSYWTNFAKTGDPNGAGLPVWPAYDSSAHDALLIGADTAATTGVRQAKLDTFDRILSWRRAR